jgi:hypothetical protein
MIEFTVTDVFRSLVVGESIVSSIFAVSCCLLIIFTECPRPGRFIGVILVCISNIAATGLVTLLMLERLGLPPGPHTWFAGIYAIAGSLGFALVTFHFIFHSPRATAFLTRQFKRSPNNKKQK